MPQPEFAIEEIFIKFEVFNVIRKKMQT